VKNSTQLSGTQLGLKATSKGSKDVTCGLLQLKFGATTPTLYHIAFVLGGPATYTSPLSLKYNLKYWKIKGQDNVVRVATGYGLDNREV
jgi:hypothetical protein